MKKVIFLPMLFVLSFFIFGCSSEDDSSNDSDNNNPSIEYRYEIKKVIGNKVEVYSQTTPAFMGTLKQHSYAIDTLEIDLNANPFLQLAIKIELAQNVDIVTPASDTIMSHVNYINFINLQSSWEDNAYQHIYLETRYSSQPKKFTYSESNLNLSDYPELFVSNPNNNTYEILEISSSIGVNLETIYSFDDFPIGQLLLYNGVKYIVISRTEI